MQKAVGEYPLTPLPQKLLVFVLKFFGRFLFQGMGRIRISLHKPPVSGFVVFCLLLDDVALVPRDLVGLLHSHQVDHVDVENLKLQDSS